MQRENQALKSYTKDLEDAIAELADVITEEDKDNGQDILSQN